MKKKLLLVDISEVIAGSVIEENVSPKLLAKTISIVQETGLKPILGTDLYTSLIDAIYDFAESGSTLNDLYSDLWQKVKPYLIHKTTAEFIVINNYRISSKGILRHNDDSSTAVDSNDLANIKNYYDNLSTTYKADIIDFLRRANLIDLRNDVSLTDEGSGWFFDDEDTYTEPLKDFDEEAAIEDYVIPQSQYTSRQLSTLRQVLIVPTSGITSNSIFQHNVDENLLAATIQTVQEVNLKPILTDSLYYSVLNSIYLNKVSGETISDLFIDLIAAIRPYIINKVVAQHIIPSTFRFTGKGLVKLNDNSATALEVAELQSIKDRYDNISTSYKSDLIDFLKSSGLYKCGSDSSLTDEASGWYFEDDGYNGSYSTLDIIPSTTFPVVDNDKFITGGTISSGVLSLFNNSGDTISISGFLSGSSNNNSIDIYITGGTLTGTVLTLVNSSGGTTQITGFTTSFGSSYITDIFIANNTLYLENNVGVGYTYIPNAATGGTYNPNTGSIILQGSGLLSPITGITFTGGSGNQDLQSVLSFGSTATTDVQLWDGASFITDSSVYANSGFYFQQSDDPNSYNRLYSSDGSPTITYSNGTTPLVSFNGSGTGIEFKKSTNSGFTWGFVNNSNLSTNRQLSIPDASGRIPISVNGVTADSVGNISITGLSSLDIYTTGMTFSSNTLTLRNNTGGTITTLLNSWSGLSITGGLSVTGSIGASSILSPSFIGNGAQLSHVVGAKLTGATFISNTLTLTNLTGGTTSVNLNSFTGLTVSGSVSAATLLGDGSNITNVPNLYNTNGSLSGDRTVQLGNNLLTFTAGTLGGLRINIPGGGYAGYSLVAGNSFSAGDNSGNLLGSWTLGNGGNLTISTGAASLANMLYFHNVLTNKKYAIAFSNTNDFQIKDAISNNIRIAINPSGYTAIGDFNNPTNQLHVSGFTNPLRLEGLQSASDTTLLTVDASGVVHTLNVSSLSGGTGSSVTEIYVTGGTYNSSAGVATFINNTGGTFTVNNFYTGYSANMKYNAQTGTSYTTVLTDGDDSTIVEMTSSSTNTVTVPSNSGVAYPIGSQITVVQKGTGATSLVAGSGVTILSAGGVLNLRAQYSFATLIKESTNTWYLVGDIGSSVGGSSADTFITGGTYNNSIGTAIFTNNSGNTFNVTGFHTGSTEIFTTGGTHNLTASTSTFTNNTGGTFIVTGYTKDVAEQSLSSAGVVWAGSAAPSGIENHRYQWMQVGRRVTMDFVLNYQNAGTSLTSVSFPLPTDLPTPYLMSGLTGASVSLYVGTGQLLVSTTTAPTATNAGKSVLRANSGGTGYEIWIGGNSGSQRVAMGTITYKT